MRFVTASAIFKKSQTLVLALTCITLQATADFAYAQKAQKKPETKIDLGLDTKAANSPETKSDESSDQLGRGAWPYRPIQNYKEGFSFLLDRQSQITLAIGAMAIVGTRFIDNQAQEHFNHQGRISNQAAKLSNDYLGSGVPGFFLGSGFWLAGDLSDSPYTSHAGQAQIESLFLTAGITSILKMSIGRERPDGSDRLSMPSGHTSTVFSSAAVLTEFYGWKAGIPAYLLGALTMGGRMQENKHWLSDTVGGATIGILVGRAIARSHLARYHRTGKDASQVKIQPVFEKGGGKLVFNWTF